MTYTPNMTRTRLFIGVTSFVHGISAIVLSDGGISRLMVKGTWEDWTWPFAMMLAGVLMMYAAVTELNGERRRTCRDLASFLLGCVWIAVGVQSLQDGQPDPITLQAPIYFFFCAWAWVQDAFSARVVALQKRMTE
jgi:hypothetical protein